MISPLTLIVQCCLPITFAFTQVFGSMSLYLGVISDFNILYERRLTIYNR